MTVAGVAFIALLTGVCYRGSRSRPGCRRSCSSSRSVRCVFAIVALVKASTGHALPGRRTVGVVAQPVDGIFGSLSNAFLLAVFIYWGWDCCLA